MKELQAEIKSLKEKLASSEGGLEVHARP